ncbi:glycosyltransferase family 4 protein [Lacticaseibacillus rhamnosus]|uniref:glycosyltransferase family 4 protein n=1 Tax=Lacticaseibacillus rhamnosus TaxID=47715 RepID=UPI0007DF18E1|nr:glycosyltransferase family 4 protein [Lacticaseibacillus rhamnosus]AQG72505.1 galactose transferase [Lacticaseibacillus rhamnosus]OAU08539.1 hypothetical protein PY76_13735 [Lacticaseibacillus rhamnosus]OAU18755.1 hypothetical protein PY77_11925 [Lacticaseibacillus rhamnosus]OAU73959.1 hypothetical protein PY62_15030 [Lacticaseibacillus rhamnosus]
MKKILYLHAGAEMYGADKILLELVEGIDKSKYKPIVILPEHGVLAETMKQKKIDVRILPYPIVRRKYFTLVGILRFLFAYVFFSFKLVNLVKSENIQLVHVNTTAVWEGAFIKMFAHVKVIWHVHEIILHPQVVYKVICFLLQHFSDQVIAVSEATASNLTKNGLVDSAKVSVVHNGIDSDLVVADSKSSVRNRLGIQSGDVIIGMVGRINAWKGQEDFLDAVIPIIQESDNVHALIIGSPYQGEEQRLVQLKDKIDVCPNSVQKRIKVIPFQKNIAEYYAAFDVFVLPSTSPDPFPTVVLEAMANALPIVGYNHGGITEMVVDGQNGTLVSPGVTSLLSNAISDLVGDKDLRQKYGLVSEQRQNQLFDLGQFVKTFEKIYNQE